MQSWRVFDGALHPASDYHGWKTGPLHSNGNGFTHFNEMVGIVSNPYWSQTKGSHPPEEPVDKRLQTPRLG